MSTNENQPTNPADEIVEMILQAMEKQNAANRARINYEQQKLEAVRKALAEDPFMHECIATAQAWREVFTTAVEDLFTPGTVIQFHSKEYTAYHVYGVVDKITSHGDYIHYFPVTSPPRRRKHPENFRLSQNHKVSVISHHSIPDAKLRKVAESLIAKIRMKDW